MATKKTRKLGTGIQRLEEKAMMAGDVAVSFSGGDMTISEASNSIGQDQQVQIYQLSNDRIRVQGLGDTRIQTPVSINGMEFTMIRSYADYTVNGDLNVSLGGGNDSLTTLNYNGGIDVDAMNVDMGAGNDRVSLSGVHTDNNLEINTHSGNDQVTVSGSQIGDSRWDDLKINTGSGTDHVTVNTTTIRDNLDITTYSDVNTYERDVVDIDNVVMDDLFARLGNGNDNMVMDFSDFDDADIDLGNGSDYLFLGYNDADDITIEGRSGNDTVRAAFNDFDDVEFNGGTGSDSFYAWYASGQNSNDIDDLDLSSATFRTYGFV